MLESFELSDVIPASPQAIYDAWLDDRHADMTSGGPASADARVSGEFTAWDGYISGTFLELDAGGRIVMAWRTTEFPADAPDSRVEVLLAAAPGGTLVTFRHSEIPEGQGDDYRQGWIDFYFTPMKAYFAGAGHS
jgi:activator of HSP90 ATPase